MYGVDEYITQYENEIGPPWKSQDLWIKISYPFFHADRIQTPTLFLGGDKDFNVPLVGGEQMYQALRSLGVDTQLVIYPDQFHGITVPSYKIDRSQRYLALVRQVSEEDRGDDDVAGETVGSGSPRDYPWVSSRFAPRTSSAIFVSSAAGPPRRARAGVGVALLQHRSGGRLRRRLRADRGIRAVHPSYVCHRSPSVRLTGASRVL